MVDHVGVVFFSADGVLIRGAPLSSAVEQRLGLAPSHGDAVPAGDRTPDAERWAGMSESAVRTELDGMPFVAGVEATTQWCWENGLVPVLTTTAWAPIAAYLADRFGFHSYHGRPLEAADGRFTGRSTGGPLDPQQQRDFAARRAGELDAAPEDCAAIGASAFDGPLLDLVGCGIAFNAPPDALPRATATVDGDDLRAILPLLRSASAARD
ncbi:HAD family hydrolase [Streptomyces sparsus]